LRVRRFRWCWIIPLSIIIVKEYVIVYIFIKNLAYLIEGNFEAKSLWIFFVYEW
jgi:hypothetical protein